MGFAAPPLALGAGSSSIMVEQPWSRATPSGAKTGAVYMTIDNKSGTADRLTGASSDVADKLQIHEMKVENGVMHMRHDAHRAPQRSANRRRFRGALGALVEDARQISCGHL